MDFIRKKYYTSQAICTTYINYIILIDCWYFSQNIVVTLAVLGMKSHYSEKNDWWSDFFCVNRHRGGRSLVFNQAIKSPRTLFNKSIWLENRFMSDQTSDHHGSRKIYSQVKPGNIFRRLKDWFYRKRIRKFDDDFKTPYHKKFAKLLWHRK